ncbi:uncharacterized protein [Physcomitrium patens]|uniref:uncharacterized protein n=1 Tax=Physcomitrium patens TaxID=3218 RepID=UPI003CCCC8AC
MKLAGFVCPLQPTLIKKSRVNAPLASDMPEVVVTSSGFEVLEDRAPGAERLRLFVVAINAVGEQALRWCFISVSLLSLIMPWRGPTGQANRRHSRRVSVTSR